MDPNFKLLDTGDTPTYDPNFKPLSTCDLETQGLLASLDATAEAEDEDFCSGGKKQERKRRLIEVGSDDDEVDTDVEITDPPTQPSQPRKQFNQTRKGNDIV
ncbi:unnamed protein product [Eruca vesicaria subsp. sativa]|uniref:Uncharacterized protein n=1 Tax=Eruca vesicaria subsp. sativa TaxID=29727 RepID=A0ABC8L7S3_ERUVS|nr:unnamed protein product [Eruca vesicaria subsp. sativa]